jgi:choice-of-anchor A domain-containing protein
MMRIVSLASVFVAATGFALASNLGVANEFNGFIFGSATLNQSDSFGALAVGSTLTLNDYQVNARNLGVNLPGKPNAGIVAGQKIVANGGAARLERGNAYSPQIQGNLLFNGGGAVVGPVAANFFSDQKAYSTTQSSLIRALPATNILGSGPAWPNVLTIDLNNVAAVEGRQVLRLDGNVLNNNKNVVLNLSNMNSARTVIIDVTGTDIDWSWVTNAQFEDKLLWNFRDAGQIKVGRLFDGSILAPKAHLIQNELIEGNIIVESWVANSRELHFANDIKKFSGSAPVPEPMTMAILALGAAALAKRRKQKSC